MSNQVDVENRLRAIDWGALNTAYGPAHRVPEWLWDLRFGHPHLADEGGHMLWSSLCHQKGQLAEAAEPALPFLLEFLPDVAPSLQCEILDILDGFAVCSSPRFGYPNSGHHARVREKLRSATSIIAAFADHEDADARSFARRILGELE